MIDGEGTEIRMSAREIHAILAEKAETDPQLEGESSRAYKMRVIPGYADMERARSRIKHRKSNRKSEKQRERERVRRREHRREMRAEGKGQRAHGRYDGDSPRTVAYGGTEPVPKPVPEPMAHRPFSATASGVAAALEAGTTSRPTGTVDDPLPMGPLRSPRMTREDHPARSGPSHDCRMHG